MNRRMDQIEVELRKMKKELTIATDAEEKSRKAMDDLASVLREVSLEATEARTKLKSTQTKLQSAIAENELLNLKLSAITTEFNKCNNEVERLRIEADETLAAWNAKETGLVECMKKVEEERTRAQAKNSVLHEEMRKLRDILKLAMAEAVAAKEAASLANAENLQLKHQLAEKESVVSKELETLRTSDAAAKDTETVDRGKGFRFDMRCTGKKKKKGFGDMVDEKAMVKGGNGSSRLLNKVETGRNRIDQGEDSLRNKALVMRLIKPMYIG